MTYKLGLGFMLYNCSFQCSMASSIVPSKCWELRQGREGLAIVTISWTSFDQSDAFGMNSC